MPYDDGDGKNSYEPLEVQEAYLRDPGNLSTLTLIKLAKLLHETTGGRDPGALKPQQLAQTLRAQGLGNVPFNTVVALSQAVSKISPEHDVLQHLSLRDAQAVIQQ